MMRTELHSVVAASVTCLLSCSCAMTLAAEPVAEKDYAGLIRLACVGDSITAGSGLRDPAKESYPAQLAALLGVKWQVRNFGVSGAPLLKKGDSTYWECKAFKDALAWRPDVVVILLGTNDSYPDNWKFKDGFAADCEALIREFRSLDTKPRIWLCAPTPVYPGAKGLDEHVLRDEITPCLRAAADKTRTGFIDLRAALDKRPGLFPDAVHPNADGARRIAETVYQSLTGRPLAEVELMEGVEYGTGGGRPLKLDIIRPKEPSGGPLPVILYVHGGGWKMYDRAQFREYLYFFARRGYFCASMDYRLSQEAKFPAQIEDCKCAVRFLRAHAREYGIDPDHIGAWGASAGGQLVSLLGTTAGMKELEGQGGWPEFSSRVQAVCDFYSPTDMTLPRERNQQNVDDLFGGPVREHLEMARLASPILHVSKDSAPFLILHSDGDPVVPLSHSQALADKLRETGVEVHLEVVKDKYHGSAYEIYHPQIRAFFDKHLKPH